MATMTELPYELLHYIILLLVQSPGGAADFARIISVCKNFILLAQDERILKLVNFDMKMELANFKRYQHINSLLVKCSEAGNKAAQFLLGKVILVSSSQLLLCEWQKAKCGVHTFDFANLGEISCILATNVPAQDYEFIPQVQPIPSGCSLHYLFCNHNVEPVKIAPHVAVSMTMTNTPTIELKVAVGMIIKNCGKFIS
ncbi:hypothetical protein POM88_050942 [Heracleum sosnowskyi]|uniref:F-box protein n=1 Tax=Heracleum sosnowskyi TaxID=360622 RepID=A0AAD8H179_9APIA|nr:hypothetical protein POM88_050942 [Heracleum sosnowskyi]